MRLSICGPGVNWLQVIWDGIPQFIIDIISTVLFFPYGYWYCDMYSAVRTISYFFVFSHRDAFLFRPFCDHGHRISQRGSDEHHRHIYRIEVCEDTGIDPAHHLIIITNSRMMVDLFFLVVLLIILIIIRLTTYNSSNNSSTCSSSI